MTARHVYRCALRWGDLDALGHVNNGRYLDYLQEARVDLLFRAAAELGARDFSTGLVVARHEVDFATPLRFRLEPIVVELWVSRVGGAFFDIAYEVRDEVSPAGTRYAAARTRLVPYEFAKGSLRRLTAEERAVLADLCHDGAAA